MRRWRIRLAVLGTGLALSAASAPTLSAWVATTSNPSGTLSAIPDWVAPAIDRHVVQKTQGGKPNYVRPGGTYHVCSRVAADTGNPASGRKDVLSNASSLTTGVLNQLLVPLGGTTPCAGTDNRESSVLTVDAATTPGVKSVSLVANDYASNARTDTASVVVDNAKPDPVMFETVNKTGGIVGRPEMGDTLVFTFDEPVDPHAIVPGWDGSGSQTVFGYFVNNGTSDRLQVFRQSGMTYPQVPLTATAGNNFVTLARNYVSTAGPVAFTASTMTVSGNDVLIVLGTPDQPTRILTDTGTTATVWYTTAALFDYAGNTLTATTITESGGADTEF